MSLELELIIIFMFILKGPPLPPPKDKVTPFSKNQCLEKRPHLIFRLIWKTC